MVVLEIADSRGTTPLAAAEELALRRLQPESVGAGAR